jgi:hypothetical protein
MIDSAGAMRHAADSLPADGESGHTIDGFVGASHRLAQTVTAQADEYFTLATVADEVGRLIYGLREDLDNIDREANDEIKRLLEANKSVTASGRLCCVWRLVRSLPRPVPTRPNRAPQPVPPSLKRMRSSARQRWSQPHFLVVGSPLTRLGE